MSKDLKPSDEERRQAWLALLRCPLCRAAGVMSSTTWTCGGCGARFPIIAGVIDFRTFAERDDMSFAHAGRRDSAQKLIEIVESGAAVNREVMIDRYLDGFFMNDDIRRRERDILVSNGTIADGWLGELRQHLPPHDPGNQLGAAVDVGCGVGGLVERLARHASVVIGIDPDLDRLLIARKTLDDSHIARYCSVGLVCAQAEMLPLATDSFDLLSCMEVLEHLTDPLSAVSEAWRVLRPAGVAYFSTPNRFTLGVEPHVNLRWLGFLPRPLMDPYVRLRRGTRYTGKRNLSYGEVRRLFSTSFGEYYAVVRPDKTAHTVPGRAANWLWRYPLGRTLIMRWLSNFRIVARKCSVGTPPPPASPRPGVVVGRVWRWYRCCVGACVSRLVR